jgi:hypothetical protein
MRYLKPIQPAKFRRFALIVSAALVLGALAYSAVGTRADGTLTPAQSGALAARPAGVPACLFRCHADTDDSARPANPAPRATAAGDVDHPCLTFTARHLEVCTAYVSNSSLAARLPYYRYSNSTNRALVIDVSNRLASRYTGDAFMQIFNQTDGWPSSVDVSVPRIFVTLVQVTPDQNFATLTTVESWSVRTEQGACLFCETRAPHTVTMQRVPGLILHKWVVTSLR